MENCSLMENYPKICIINFTPVTKYTGRVWQEKLKSPITIITHTRKYVEFPLFRKSFLTCYWPFLESSASLEQISYSLLAFKHICNNFNQLNFVYQLLLYYQ